MRPVIYLSLLLLSVFGGTGAYAQQPAYSGACQTIDNGLVKGRAGDVAGYFGSLTDLTVAASRNSCSRAQGEVILADFFSKHPPRAYQSNHSGPSGSGFSTIGTLTTAGGSYKVYYQLRARGRDVVLTELRIEQ